MVVYLLAYFLIYSFIHFDLIQDPKEKDRTGTTALHKAAANGHVEIVQLLIERGGDINQPDITESTALHAAARNGHMSEFGVKIIDQYL